MIPYICKYVFGGGARGHRGRAVSLAEGATLVGLYLPQQGMARRPRYILKVETGVTCLKVCVWEIVNEKSMEEGETLTFC